MRKFYLFFIAVMIPAGFFTTNTASAQNFAFSSNILQYLNFGTLNAEASLSVSRHWSLNVGTLYNPFHFNFDRGKRKINNRQRVFNIGARFWPWHVYSGWWLYCKTQYQEYDFGGLYNKITREGESLGAGVSAGYSYMLGKHFNLEFGAGIWSGLDNYKIYSCPSCGTTLKTAKKWFVLPDNITVALSYIF